MGVSKWPMFLIAILAVLLYALNVYLRGCVCNSKSRLDGKVAIVTGGNKGLGKETALDLARRGCKVIIACRSMERGVVAVEEIAYATGVTLDKVKVIKLDLASLDSVRTFAKEFRRQESRLDILINNAGIINAKRQETVDGFEAVFGTNHLGHFLLTNLLLDMLKTSSPSRVVTLSSGIYAWSSGINWDDVMYQKDYTQFNAYSQSKLANVLFTQALAKRLEGTGVSTYAVHPGMVATEMNLHSLGGWLFLFARKLMKTPWQGAQTQICCAVDDGLAAESGKYYSDCEAQEVSQVAMDTQAAERLWELSMELVEKQKQQL